MTTIVCDRKGMAADKLVTGLSKFRTKKLFRIGDSLIGIAGDLEACLRFIEWRRNGGDRPVFNGVSMGAIELTKGGITLWGDELVPMQIEEPYYAIGTGGAYALGALTAGATIQEAVKAAARWDEATGPEVQVMTLGGK